MTQNTIKKAKKAKICTNRMMPSASGRCWVQKMLNPTVRRVNAKMSKVICQSSTNFVSGCPIATISCIMPESWMAHAGTPAIQPTVDAQPTV